jgi:hypothetical protein
MTSGESRVGGRILARFQHGFRSSLVTRVRAVVNVKDSFTRLSQERDNDRREHQRLQQAQAEVKRRRREERESLRRRLSSLRGMTVPRQRGLAFEGLLNDIFKLDGLSVREAFTLGNDSGQVGEQIDGLVVMDGAPILVEAKWHGDPLGVNDVSRHLVRVYNRPPGVHGLIVSASQFSTSAIDECTRALTNRARVHARRGQRTGHAPRRPKRQRAIMGRRSSVFVGNAW